MTRKRVAIIGYSFRLPGSAGGVFWDHLLAGRNLVTEVPPDRWARDSYWHPRRSHPGSSYTFAAGTIGDIAGFDAEFFGISPREAAQTDPQQRLLLELAWEALENAGIPPSTLRGSRAGVFVGVSTIDYSFRFADDLSAIESSVATGTSSSIAANRVSYAFDLRGPSIAVDTACSSSLVAFHLACRSIASGESEHALVGGVSLHMHPYGFVSFSKASMLSRRGACRVFDADADGYVRSEGGGVFVLKDYDRAMADGDPVLALVAGTATNSDGRKSGLTVPSVEAQSRLLEEAYSAAGISPSEIDYVEAHGTGTPVGDPIEAQALGVALGRHRPRGQPLLIGSVKSNIGHLEAAAGVAGLVKAMLCIEHRTVPANIHFDTPNPNIRFDDWNIRVAQQATVLKSQGRVVIGVNSFGFGGTNAHAVLESPEPREGVQPAAPEPVLRPFVISGKSVAALKAVAARLATHLQHQKNVSLRDVASTLALRRELHEHRAVVRADTVAALAGALEALSRDPSARLPGVESGTALGTPAPVAFVYTGNGAAWAGMGRRLMAEDPGFRAAVDDVDRRFRVLGGRSVAADLVGAGVPADYERTEISQPALFALQVGLTRALGQRGLAPSAVAGHSVGEVAAAWAAGALTLDQAVEVIHHRSRLQGLTRGKGRMTAAAISGADAEALLADAGLAGKVVIAGINSSRSVTFAGPVEALEQLEAAMGARSVAHRRLALDYAFHSAAMDAIGADLAQSLSAVRPSETRIPFHSTVSGGRLDGAALDAGYWWANIREPVLFEQAMKHLLEQGARVVVEIGPHPLLRGYVTQALQDARIQGRFVPTLLRDDDAPARLDAAISQCVIAGAPVDRDALLPERGLVAALPAYPWQREPYWHAVSAESYQRLARPNIHPLLGHRLHEQDWAWEAQLDTLLCPMLADHVIGDATVMPGTGFAEMALAAGRSWLDGAVVDIDQLEIRAPLVLGEAQTKTVRFTIDAPDGSFSIRSRNQASRDAWTLHAVGRLLRDPRAGSLTAAAFALPDRPADVSAAEHGELTAAAGLSYGPAFRTLREIWVEKDLAFASFDAGQQAAGKDHYGVHPAMLDCAFQLIIQLLRDEYTMETGTVYVPAQMEGVQFRVDAARPAAARAQLLQRGPHSITASFVLADANGTPVIRIDRVRFSSARLQARPADRISYPDYRLVLRRHPAAPDNAPRRLQERLQEKLGAVADLARRRDANRRYEAEIEPLLDELCCRYAVRALRCLASGRDVFTTDDRESCLRANPDAAPLLDCLIAMLTSEPAGAVEESLPLRLSDDALTPEDIWNSLIADYPDFLPVFHAVGRVGMHLPGILSGQRALSDILPRGCTPGALACASLADLLPVITQTVRDFASETLQQLPLGRRFRIMEFSAGAPLFAGSICSSLDFGRSDYLLATLPGADDRQTLRDRFPCIEIVSLDPADTDPTPLAEGDPVHLALITAGFSNDHEAVAVLTQLKQRLAPRAAVMLVDQHPARWMDFVFGGNREWWSESARGSRTSVQKRPHVWRHHLQQLGYGAGRSVDLSARGDSGPYLLLAREGERVPLAPMPVLPKVRTWCLLVDKEGFSARLGDQVARALQARGDRVLRITPGGQVGASSVTHYHLNPCSAEQFQSLVQRIQGAAGDLAGMLHLYGLEAASETPSPLLMLDRQVDRCASAAAMVRACEEVSPSTTCWMLTSRVVRAGLRNASGHSAAVPAGMDAALWGFCRTLMNEAPAGMVRLIDIDDVEPLDATIFSLVREVTQPTPEDEIVLARSGERYVPRLRVGSLADPVPAASLAEHQTASLQVQQPGQIRSLRWEAQPRASVGADEVEVQVQATGLNFRDVMYTLGLLSDQLVENGFAGPSLGLEFAGTVSAAGAGVRGISVGDRVVGFGPASFANRVVTRSTCVAAIPADMPFAAAATIPSAFLTAHYALGHLARLEHGESVLIHGAAGGVGIAAIRIAQSRGATILATAGSPEKRDFLHLMGVHHVFDSRSLAYADEILALTGGDGVDVVLNSIAGEAVNRNLKVLKPFGRFLELGKRDFQENARIGLAPFRNNLSYFGIDADQLMKDRPELTRRLFSEIMGMFADGTLSPLPYRSFDAGEVTDAFRCMQQSRHIGKIVLTYAGGIPSVVDMGSARRGLELSAEATYLVTGGLRGFGLRTAQWLAAKGARNLVLATRSGRPDPEAVPALAELEAMGVKVRSVACDVADLAALSALFSEVAATMPPLGGVIHAAAVIEDGVAANLSRAQLRRVMAPKILGAHHLHQLTLGMDLEFFVLFSSATTLFGNPGQAGYVAANAGIEALAAARREQGLPAVCVRWGAIDDAGYLARNAQIKAALQGRMGGAALSSAVALDALEAMLLGDRSGHGVMELDWKALRRFLPTADSPKFSDILSAEAGDDKDDPGERDLRRLFDQMPPAELTGLLVHLVKKEVGQILHMAPERIDEDRVLHEMGFDSLMGVELSAAIETRFDVRLPVMALSDDPTITKLAARILSHLSGDAAERQRSSAAVAAEEARRIAALHADEAHAEQFVSLAESIGSGNPGQRSKLIQ